MADPAQDIDLIDAASMQAPAPRRRSMPRSKTFEAGLLAVSAILLLIWTSVLGWFVFELLGWLFAL
ncbi:MAG: hypothetical protein JWL62_216 [Hyphomicrobiales bacterium]|nr:hypothetical protein [Hyphomicrobiales bacterium]